MSAADQSEPWQYEDYPYPEPFDDIAAKIAGGYIQVGDPSLYAPMLWPEGRPRKDLNILVAGCGTVQAAVIAYRNPEVHVLGVDMSAASLTHQRKLKASHKLDNLTLEQDDLRNVAKHGRDFDLVICTGVLMHLTDPEEGLRALAGVLAPHGSLLGMVYAATRRTGVYMLQDAFRRLNVPQTRDGVRFVRETLTQLPPQHFINWYLPIADELVHDTAIVDTFLNRRDRPYTVPQLMNFIRAGGLGFQSWVENALYFPEAMLDPDGEIAQRLARLPEREQWAVMEMLTLITGTHNFIARHPARNKYAISFAGDDWESFIPHQAPGVTRVGPRDYARGSLRFSISDAEVMLYDGADGVRTIRQILDQPGLARIAKAELDPFGRRFYELAWKAAHMMISRSV